MNHGTLPIRRINHNLRGIFFSCSGTAEAIKSGVFLWVVLASKSNYNEEKQNTSREVGPLQYLKTHPLRGSLLNARAVTDTAQKREMGFLQGAFSPHSFY